MAFCQNSDSLKIALKNAKHDTMRCRILNVMLETEGDNAIWQVYNEQLKSLAEKIFQQGKHFQIHI